MKISLFATSDFDRSTFASEYDKRGVEGLNFCAKAAAILTKLLKSKEKAETIWQKVYFEIPIFCMKFNFQNV